MNDVINCASQEPNTLVIDLIKGWGLEYIEKPEGGTFWYKNHPYYLMYRSYSTDPAGTLEGITRPNDIDTLPEKLYRALHWKECCKVLFMIKPSLLERLTAWAMIALVALLIVFMIILLGSMGVI